jgi:hypothetical protein
LRHNEIVTSVIELSGSEVGWMYKEPELAVKLNSAGAVGIALSAENAPK